MSELREYFKDNNMLFDLEHFDEYSEDEKEYWKETIGFKRWKVGRDFKEAMLEIRKPLEPFMKWLNDKLS